LHELAVQYGGIDGASSRMLYVYGSTYASKPLIGPGSAYPLQLGSRTNGFRGYMMEFGIYNNSDSTYLKQHLENK